MPKNIVRALRALENAGVLNVRTRERFGWPKREYQALKPADPSVFDHREREIVKEAVNVVCENHTAVSTGELSHDLIWDAAEIGEDIPIGAALAANSAPLTPEDFKWADEVIERRAGRRGARAALAAALT